MGRRLSLLLFPALVAGAGLLIGSLTVPGGWYAQLAKPSYNPPGWLFAPVWTVLYILIAIAGWQVYQRDSSGMPMRLWWMQLGLNFLWTPTFFSAHQIGLALLIILALLAIILGFIASSLRQNRLAAWLFAPYAVWVAFASLLNASILVLN
jgi:tryptophan-rich sensory protein